MELTETTVSDTADTGSGFRLARGDLVDRYVIVEKVGVGGMGAVYSAYDPDLDRRLAIKVLHASEGPSGGSSARQRLLREAQAMARLSHPNVVDVLDVGRHRGEVFVAMKFVDGMTLGESLAREPRTPREILHLFNEAASGLQAAHEAGLVHRDFKPANVMIDRQGHVFVMDLGLARMPGRGAAPPIELLEHAADESTLDDLTRTGALMGTPAYMSPEQYLGAQVDARSDQFSFFVALHEALYGQRPFRGESPAALAFNVTQGELAEPATRSGVPAYVYRVIQRGLRVEPDQRYPSMREVQAALAPRRSPIVPALVGLAAVSLLAGGMLWGTQEEEDLVCAGAQDAIATIWNDERKTAIRDAFAGTGLAYAPDAANRTIISLDEHSRAWAEQRRSSCEATHVFREQSEEILDLRTACLDTSVLEFDALVAVLSEADADTVGNTVRAISNLRPLAQCADISALRSGIEPPADAATRAQVESARERLHRARMLDQAGRYPEGAALVEGLEKEATEIGYLPLVAEVENVYAILIAHTGDWAASEKHFERAYFTSMGGVHPEEAARASTTLIKAVGSPFALGRRDDGLEWARHAEGAVRRLDDDGVMEAMWLANVGHVLALSPESNAEAVEKLRMAADKLEAALGPSSYRVVLTLNDLAYALGQQDAHDEAIAVLQRVLAIEETLVGAEHPLTAATRGTLGISYIGQKRYDEGIRETQASIDIMERTVGADHPNISSMLVNLATIYDETDRHADMIAPLERAVAIRSAKMGPGHPIYLWTLGFLGYAYSENGRFDAALATAERALAESGELPQDHRHVQGARMNRAEALIDLGRADEALPALEHELAGLGADVRPARLASIRRLLARARYDTGQKRQAIALARAALEELPADTEGADELRAKIEAWLAEHPA